MRISDLNWMQLEKLLARERRAVVPIGSTEQHGYLSLSVDAILAERVAVEAAEPLGVPVFPVLNYGITPYFLKFHGTVSLQLETYQRIIGDILDSLAGVGFQRILFLNGHGGNSPATDVLPVWTARHPGVAVRWHNWWNAPKTAEAVQAIDPDASHASWMENFPWTRLANVVMPADRKPMIDISLMRQMDAAGVREYLGDGNFGGHYQKPDDAMDRVWRAGVEEARAAIEGPWS